MEFWIFMTICDLVVPVVMIAGGFVLRGRANISSTDSDRKVFPKVTDEVWVRSHHICARVWIVVGSIMLVLTAIFQFLLIDSEHSHIGNMGILFVTLQCLVLLITLVHVEHAVKKIFDGAVHR